MNEHRTRLHPSSARLWPHPAQSGLLVARKLGHRGVNCACVYQVSGELDERRLASAYETALNMFDILRLAIEDDGVRPRWFQVTEPRVEVRHENFTIQQFVPGEVNASFIEVLQQRADRAFDLTTGPIGVVEIFRVDWSRWVVVEAFDHVFADGRSLGILHDVVSGLYRNETKPRLENDSYTALLADRPRDARPDTAEYWSRMFDGFERVALGTSSESGEPDEWRLTLDADRVAGLARAAGQLRGTLAAAFLAAHSHAVARHLGTGDISTQVPIDGRAERSSGTFGQLTSLVPLRVRHDWSQAVGTRVSALTRAILDVRDHLDVDMETLDRLGAPMGLGKPDASAFVMQDARPQIIDLPEVDISPLVMRSADQVGGLVTVARRQPDGSIDLSVRAPHGSYFANLLTSVGETIDTTLTVMATAPRTPIGSDLLLPPTARDLVTRLGDPSPPYPFSSLTDDIIANLITLGCRPVIDGNEPCRAVGLLQRVRRIERALRDAAVSHGDAVLVGDLPVVDRVAAFVAVLHVGAVYVPFDNSEPTTEKERKEHIVRAVARLTSDGVVRVHSQKPACRTQPGPRSPAYVIFTSGSSGFPKAVTVSRESLSNLVRGEAQRFGISPDSRISLVATPTVDPWICHVATALLFRATLVPVDGMSDVPVAEQLRAKRVTHAFLPAALLRSLDAIDLPSLQMVATAGDHCRAEDLARFAGRRVFNIYGPTETTVTAAVAELESPTDPVPIGRPIRGMGARVVIDRAASAPPGVHGELALSGVGVALGYAGEEALTARSFGDDPFNPGHRWYLTGDRAYLSPTGSLVLGGRMDRQVKIRGMRVELESIEAAARASGMCDHAHVKVFTVPPSIDKRLVLFVEGCHDVDAFTAALRELVPPHSHPHKVVAVHSLPRTAAGKIADDLLPRRYADLTEAGRQQTAVQPPGALSRIWADLLGVAPNPEDNFFSSGGDSLTVLRLVRDARANGMTLSPTDVYNHPRYGELRDLGLARQLRLGRDAGGSVPHEVPLGPAQQWFLSLGLTNPRWWNQRHVIAFDSLPDRGLLEDALVKLVAATPILRSAVDARAHQFVVHEPQLTSVSVLDAAEADEVLRDAVDELSSGIDHLRGAVLKALAIRGSRGDGVLVLVVHHLVIDTWSWNVVEERLRRILDGVATAVTAADIDHGFSRFASSVARQLNAGAFDLDVPLWTTVLSGGRTAHIGARPRSIERVMRIICDADQVTSGWGAPTSRVLLASIGEALHAWEGAGATVVDLERNGRGAVAGLDVSDAVGWFALHHPVVLDHAVLSPRSIAQVSANIDEAPDFGLSYGALRWSGRADMGEGVGRFAVDVSDLREPKPEKAGSLAARVRELQAPTNQGNRLPYEATVSFRRRGDEISAIVEFDSDRVTTHEATSILDSVAAAIQRGCGRGVPRPTIATTTAFDALVPASSTQRLMLHHAGRAPGTYRARQLLAFDRVSDPAALLDSVGSFLASFDPFRRRFTRRGGDLFQTWLPQVERIPIRRFDAGRRGADEWLEGPDEVDETAVLDGGPPLDAVAFIDGEEVLLGLEVHHAVMDGWSNRTLLGDLNRFVASWHAGEARTAPQSNIHRRALRKHVAAETAAGPLGNIPSAATRTRTSPPMSIAFELSKDRVQDLTRWAHRNAVDLRSTFAAATARALRTVLGVSSLYVVANGRDADLPETAEALGMFWYFQEVPLSDVDPVGTATSFYRAAAEPLVRIRAAAAQWAQWPTAGASFNFTKQETTTPRPAARMIRSRDLFHFDNNVHVDLRLNGSTLIRSTSSLNERQEMVLESISESIDRLVRK